MRTLSALMLFLISVAGWAVNPTVHLSLNGVVPRDIAVNTGDTVSWVNDSTNAANWSRCVGGEWQSPVLTNAGDSFSFTFTNAGFRAYSTTHGVGTVTVCGWTNAPPAVTINTPFDGYLLPTTPGDILVLASVTNGTAAARVEFYANTNLIGVATTPPYSVFWTNQAPGSYALVAKAVGTNASFATSSPVNVVVGKDRYIWGARVLPGGRFFFFYNADPWIRTVAASFPQVPLAGIPTILLLTRGSPGPFVVVDDQSGPAKQPAAFYGLFKEVAP